MSFAQLNLDTPIFKALSACGYTKPTPIQVRSIPDILNGRDLVASAQTGTGKTAAFVLPALHRLSTTKATSKPRVLILTPTRELATQITEAASKYGKFLRFNIVSLVGGMPYHKQLRDLARPVDIIVATPGRLLDHMANKRVDLSAIEMLIFDEADRMLDMGFIDDVRDIAKITPKNRQTLLFSATVDNKLSHIIKGLMNDPVRVDLSQEKMAPTKITQELYLADNLQHKTRLLQHFLANETIYKAIIFCATKVSADSLAIQLSKQGFAAAPLHGDLKQNVRNRTLEQLRKGSLQFLIATDVAARGIDVSDITHVFNYDLPKFSEDYVHRIGRTGRAGKSGIAISFLLPLDGKHLQKIEKYIGQKLEFSTIEGLEPTKSLSNAGKAPSAGRGKKKFGQSNNSGKGYARKSSDAGRSYARKDRDDDRGYVRKERDGGKSYARKSTDGANSNYARKEGAPRKSYAEKTNDTGAGRSYARKERDGDRGYARKSTEGGRSYARQEGVPRKSYTEKSNDTGAGRSYARKERDGDRSYAGKSTEGGRSYARQEGAPRKSYTEKPNDAGAGRGYARKERDGDRSYAGKSTEGGRSYVRKEGAPRISYTEKSSGAGKSFARKSGGAAGGKSFAGKTGDKGKSFARKPGEGAKGGYAGKSNPNASRTSKPKKKLFEDNKD